MNLDQQLSSLYPAHLATVKKRTDESLAETGYEQIAIFSGAQILAFLDDNAYPFRVSPHFKYWLPVLQNPHCFVLYAPGEKPLLVYYQPVDYWHKPASDPTGHWVEHFDIRVIAKPEAAKDLIPKNRKTAFVGEWQEIFDGWSFAEKNPKDLLERLHYERARKTEYEIVCINEANRIGARGHVAAERAFRSGASEHEIHLEYLRATLHIEEELPYGNIIALNENGSVLHYQTHLIGRARHANPRSFLIDAGAQFNGYVSDITRTYSREHDEFESLIDAFNELQLALCDDVKPGVDYRDLHLSAHRKVGDLLQRFGFIDVDGATALQKKITSAFFPHGLGHFLGLQVHDVAGYAGDRCGATIDKPEGHPYLRLTRLVESEQVFTIEPGLYFIETLLKDLRKSDEAKHVNWTKVDAFRPFGGIRIEDDVVVTADGHRNLTREAFTELGVAPRREELARA